MNDKLFESILSYSDFDGISENELVEPLGEDESLNQLFEKIYYECRLKPLFEQIYREAHLREMAALTTSQFENALMVKIKYSVENNETLNSNMTEKELSDSIK